MRKVQYRLITLELIIYLITLRYVYRRSAKLRKATTSFVMPAALPPACPSVRPYRACRLQLDVFSWNLVFEYFSKIFLENSNLIKI